MNVTVNSSIIGKIWHLLVHPLPPIQHRAASEIMVRVAREGWARRIDVENILGELGVYAEGDELLVPLSNALQRPWQDAFYTPKRRYNFAGACLALPTADAAMLVITLESCGKTRGDVVARCRR